MALASVLVMLVLAIASTARDHKLIGSAGVMAATMMWLALRSIIGQVLLVIGIIAGVIVVDLT
ncbi:hypothetical protein [Actinomadura formosensis]|uniref:hypothetical protein n=1 Tax=Actinomadura formosensis TaxID=60706 RepID=UPI0008348088|nr:hypothetical protein [Actinomadura formosensis]